MYTVSSSMTMKGPVGAAKTHRAARKPTDRTSCCASIASDRDRSAASATTTARWRASERGRGAHERGAATKPCATAATVIIA